jgi:cyclase
MLGKGLPFVLMRVTTLAADVHVAIGNAYDSASFIFFRGDEALLVDTLGSRADAGELRQWIEGHGKRVRLIVSTHYFSDHIAGHALFAGAEIVAHENYAGTWSTEKFRSDEELTHFVAPTITFHDRMTIRWGARTLELFHNPGHTASTIGVDVPSLDLLHVGDTIVGNIVYLAYGAPEALANAIDRARGRGRARVATSHGLPRHAVALDHAAHYLATFNRKVAAGESAIPLDDCLPRGVRGNDFETIFHQRNLDFRRPPA